MKKRFFIALKVLVITFISLGAIFIIHGIYKLYLCGRHTCGPMIDGCGLCYINSSGPYARGGYVEYFKDALPGAFGLSFVIGVILAIITLFMLTIVQKDSKNTPLSMKLSGNILVIIGLFGIIISYYAFSIDYYTGYIALILSFGLSGLFLMLGLILKILYLKNK